MAYVNRPDVLMTITDPPFAFFRRKPSSQFRFRPEDRMASMLGSKPLQACSRLLLRYSVRRNKRTGESQVVGVEVAGVVAKCFSFVSLADFVYLTSPNFKQQQTVSKTKVRHMHGGEGALFQSGCRVSRCDCCSDVLCVPVLGCLTVCVDAAGDRADVVRVPQRPAGLQVHHPHRADTNTQAPSKVGTNILAI